MKPNQTESWRVTHTTNINGHQIEMATVEIGIKKYNSFYLCSVQCTEAKWNSFICCTHKTFIHRASERENVVITKFFHSSFTHTHLVTFEMMKNFVWHSIYKISSRCFLHSIHRNSLWLACSLIRHCIFISAWLLFVIVHSLPLPETKFYSMMVMSIDLHCNILRIKN